MGERRRWVAPASFLPSAHRACGPCLHVPRGLVRSCAPRDLDPVPLRPLPACGGLPAAGRPRSALPGRALCLRPTEVGWAQRLHVSLTLAPRDPFGPPATPRQRCLRPVRPLASPLLRGQGLRDREPRCARLPRGTADRLAARPPCSSRRSRTDCLPPRAATAALLAARPRPKVGTALPGACVAVLPPRPSPRGEAVTVGTSRVAELPSEPPAPHLGGCARVVARRPRLESTSAPKCGRLPGAVCPEECPLRVLPRSPP